VIRTAAGGGYALPPISDLVGTNTTPICFGGAGSCNVTLTNLNLKPEKSFGFDVGTDMRLHHDTVLSFDLYQTNLYGQFFQSTSLTGTFMGLPLYTTQYNNLAESRYEGITLDVRHDVARGMYWHGALGLTRAYVVSVPPGFYDSLGPLGSGPNSVNTYIVPGMNFDGEYQSTVPYANGTAQIGYRWSPEKYIDLSPTYYGNNNAYFRPAFVELDAHAGYPLAKNIQLLATFRNITGIYGENYEYYTPSLAAPTVSGAPYPLFGIPYGPRSIIVTANFKY
jgi:outer membrane receptor protein involved in Fe transport